MSSIRSAARRAGVAAAAAGLLFAFPTAAPAATNGFPDSMAAIGDSITQAANLDGSTLGSSNPQHSWSTGYDSADGILSHYERLLANNANIASKNHNDAVSGAKMVDAPAQADQAVQQQVEYVTFLMGGNDVCTSSKDNMTPVNTYEAQFRSAMDKLAAGLPNAQVYVVSVPDVYQLWKLFNTNKTATRVWSTFGICQSMLAKTNTESDRQFVRQRNIDFNTVLQNACAEYVQCRYDGGAIFSYQFTKTDVSTVDYFHPSKTGQANIAKTSWANGYWPTS